jgi:hypothetical protein
VKIKQKSSREHRGKPKKAGKLNPSMKFWKKNIVISQKIHTICNIYSILAPTAAKQRRAEEEHGPEH